MSAIKIDDRVVGPRGFATVVNTAHFHNAYQVRYDSGNYRYELVTDLTPVMAPDPLAPYDGSAGDLVPGYADTAAGQADAADQARADRGNR